MSNYNQAARAVGTASTVVVRRGMGPLGMLGIIFVLLKLFGMTAVAGWSWWLVLLPFYIGFAIVLGIWAIIFGAALVAVVLFGVVYAGACLMDKWKSRKYRKPTRPLKGRSF